MLGLGHAILTSEPLIEDKPFAVALADDFILYYFNSSKQNLFSITSNKISIRIWVF